MVFPPMKKVPGDFKPLVGIDGKPITPTPQKPQGPPNEIFTYPKPIHPSYMFVVICVLGAVILALI